MDCVNFSNKENKKKRRAAEIDQAVRLGGVNDPSADKVNLGKVRQRRNQDFVDPLKYRSTLKEDKIFKPYGLGTSKRSSIPLWADKSRGVSERMKLGGMLGNQFIGTEPSQSDAVRAKAQSIDKKRWDAKMKSMYKPDSAPVPAGKSGSGKGLLIGAGLGVAGLGAAYLATRKKKNES